MELARRTGEIVRDLEVSLIERDVESVASEVARIALLQTADSLTTAKALLFSATHALESVSKSDPKLPPVLRLVSEARRAVETTAGIAEGYFASAYANRDSSPAEVDRGIQDAIRVSLLHSKAHDRNVAVDFQPLNHATGLQSTSGIDFLLMLIPAISQALALCPDGTTLQIRAVAVNRLDETLRDVHLARFLWFNRRNATTSFPGVAISLRSNAAALERETIDDWLNGRPTEALGFPGRGIAYGIHKSKGLLGIAASDAFARFEMALALPI